MTFGHYINRCRWAKINKRLTTETEQTMKATILILDGPNLNLVGVREPHIYGHQRVADYIEQLRRAYSDIEIVYRQSNHEGVLIDLLQEYGFGKACGIVLNGGGYSHTSVALRDCVAALTVPVAEVHISDISTREPFRQHSYLTEVCSFTIKGRGLDGYRVAIEQFIGGATEKTGNL